MSVLTIKIRGLQSDEMPDMRVTAETKEATRRTILNSAQELFQTLGYEVTTTRDIARTAGIATGTLFNYFPTKEAIVTALVVDSQCRLGREASKQHGSMEEALFSHIARGMRVLKPYRKYLSPVLETALSPIVASHHNDGGQSLRTDHLETVVKLARQYGLETTLTPMNLYLYWTLYLGVLSFWTNDNSPRQEETLALIDQSLAMFVSWLRGVDDRPNTDTRNPS
jgi:AcrR family transcriptional regulator